MSKSNIDATMSALKVIDWRWNPQSISFSRIDQVEEIVAVADAPSQ
jgi:hypothetical protein